MNHRRLGPPPKLGEPAAADGAANSRGLDLPRRLDDQSGDGAEATGVLSLSPEVRAGLVEAACRAIKPERDRERLSLMRQLDAVVANYLFYKNATSPVLPPKAVRERLHKLRGSVAKLIDEIGSLPSEVVYALDPLVPPLSDDDLTQDICDALVESLGRFEQAIDTFDREYQPPIGRGANLALQSALMLASRIVKTATGETIRARFDKPAGTPPEFITPATRAIRDLLMGIDPTLSALTIANMLEKLRTKGPTPSYAEAMQAPGLAAALDLSLLPKPKPE